MSSKIKSAAKKLVNGLNAGKVEVVYPIEGMTETNLSLSEVEKLMLDCGFQLGNEYGDMAVEYNRDVIFGRRKTLVTVLQVVSDSCDEENGWCIDSPVEDMMYFGNINKRSIDMSQNDFGSGNGMAGLFDDAEYISVHTRAQMLEDGDLVDLNQFIPVKESGYKYPVACTSAVWNIIDRAVKNKRYRNDYKGVVWDVLNMSRLYPVKRWDTGQLFEVLITGVGNKNGRKGSFRFKIECTGGDDLAPVMTISMPEED